METVYQNTNTDLDEVTAGVEELIETADAVLAAAAADAVDDGLFGKVGLLGTDLPGLLEEARAAFEVGDHDLARAKAQEVVDTIDQAPDVGKGRSLWVGAAVLLFLLLVVGVVLLVRRRKRSRRAAAAAAIAVADAAAAAGLPPELAPDTDDQSESAPTDPTFDVASMRPDEASKEHEASQEQEIE